MASGIRHQVPRSFAVKKKKKKTGLGWTGRKLPGAGLRPEMVAYPIGRVVSSCGSMAG